MRNYNANASCRGKQKYRSDPNQVIVTKQMRA